MSEPYENTLSTDQLRAEVRRCWDRDAALNDALIDLPEIPSVDVMAALTHAAMNMHRSPVKNLPFMEAARKLQSSHPSKIDANGCIFQPVPFKTEYEYAAGLWTFIRNGLLLQEEAINGLNQ